MPMRAYIILRQSISIIIIIYISNYIKIKNILKLLGFLTKLIKLFLFDNDIKQTGMF